MSKILDPQELDALKRAMYQSKNLILRCDICERLIREVDPDDYDDNYHCPFEDCDGGPNDIEIYGTEA